MNAEMRKLMEAMAKRDADMRAVHEGAKADGRSELNQEEQELWSNMMQAQNVDVQALEREKYLEAQSARLDASAGTPMRFDIEEGGENRNVDEDGRPIYGGSCRNMADILNAVFHNQRERMEELREHHRAFFMGTGATGGLLVPAQIAQELHEFTPEEAIVRPRAEVIRGEASSPDAPVPHVGVKQGGEGVYGTVIVTPMAEGATITETSFEFTGAETEPKELGAFTVTTEKLLRNASAANTKIMNALRRAVIGAEDRYFLTGNGTGVPHGIQSCKGKLTVARDTSDDVKLVDVVSMQEKMVPESLASGRAIWVASQTMFKKLYLSIKDDAGHNLMLRGDATKGLPPVLLGAPVRFTGRVKTLGNEGDLGFYDFSHYTVHDGAPIRLGTSEHFFFTSNKIIIKIMWSVDGACLIEEPLKLEDGVTDVSPVVLLK